MANLAPAFYSTSSPLVEFLEAGTEGRFSIQSIEIVDDRTMDTWSSLRGRSSRSMLLFLFNETMQHM
jgi:hypothetical protein